MKPKLKDKESQLKNFSSKLADPDTIRRLTDTTDDMLKTLISMSSALLAIGVIFDSFVKAPVMRILIILLFFIGLIISFVGVLPFNVRYDLEDAEDLKNQQVGIFLRKRRHLWFSAGAMVLGFLFVIVDLIIDVFSKSPMG